MSFSEEVSIAECGDMFQEPEDYFKKPKPDRIEKIEIEDEKMELRVIGEHSLWGNYIWNASKLIAKKFILNSVVISSKNVLELGAAAGIPSIVAVRKGASYVVATDYDDADLVDNLRFNVEKNLSLEQRKNVDVFGYVWNTNNDVFLSKLRVKKFDVIILSDLIFNHSQHLNLIESCIVFGIPEKTKILIAFSHHVPLMSHLNLKFFDLLEQFKFIVTKEGEYEYPVMFEEDPGDVKMRKTVYFYLAEFTKDSLTELENFKEEKRKKTVLWDK